MIRVVIADDHHLVWQGLRTLLEKAGNGEVVGEAADGQEALELVERLLPDVLVLDIAMLHLNGVDAVGRLRDLKVKTRTLVLSMHANDTLVRQALRRAPGPAPSRGRGLIKNKDVCGRRLLFCACCEP